MIAMLFSVVLLAGCFAAGAAVWAATSRRCLVLTPFLMFALYEAVFAWPAVIYAQAEGICDAYPAILMSTAFVGFLAGFLLSFSHPGRDRTWLERYRDAPVQRPDYPVAMLVLLAAVAAGLALAGLYLYQGPPPILLALWTLAQGSGFDDVVTTLSTQREALNKGYLFEGGYRGQGVIQQVQQIGWPFLTLAAVVLHRGDGKRRWRVLAGVCLVCAVAFIGGVGQRYQVMMIFVYLLVGLSLLIRVRIRHLVLSGIFLLTSVLIVGLFSGQMAGLGRSDRPLTDALGGVTSRILLGNGMTNIEVIGFIDQGLMRVQNGAIHAEKLVAALPGVSGDVPFSVRVQQLRTARDQDTTFASMTYFGILYADFGPLGPIVGYLLMGLFIGSVQNVLFRFAKGALEVPTVAFVSYYCADLSLGSSVSVAASLFVLGLFRLLLIAGYRFLGGWGNRVPAPPVDAPLVIADGREGGGGR